MRQVTAPEKPGRQRSDPRRRHCTLRATVLLIAFALPAIPADESPRDIVVKALDVADQENKLEKQYAYVEHTVENKLDSSGAVKSKESKTWDVVQLEGSQFRRLIQHNDRTLTPKEESAEKSRQDKVAQQRKNEAAHRAAETPEKRQKAEETRKREQQKDRGEDADIASSFDLRIVGEEQIDGKPVWVIEGTPYPGYKFKFKEVSFMSKMKGRIWISKADYQPVKIEAETLDTISFGAILARIQKGATLHAEFTRVNDEVWLPKRFSVTASARLLLVKGLHEEVEQTFRDYKKFSVESHIVD